MLKPLPRETPLPPALAEVALVNAAEAAAVGSVSLTWWHSAVRAGIAPQPAMRTSRCVRWKMEDVRRFWLAQTEAPQSDVSQRKAKHASAVHHARRRAAQAAQAAQAATAVEV